MCGGEAAFGGREKRAKQPWVEEQIIRDRGYCNLCLAHENLAELEHKPQRANRHSTPSYRFFRV
jgi:hypothetical protein